MRPIRGKNEFKCNSDIELFSPFEATFTLIRFRNTEIQNTEISDEEHSDSEFYYLQEQETAERKASRNGRILTKLKQAEIPG